MNSLEEANRVSDVERIAHQRFPLRHNDWSGWSTEKLLQEKRCMDDTLFHFVNMGQYNYNMAAGSLRSKAWIACEIYRNKMRVELNTRARAECLRGEEDRLDSSVLAKRRR